MGSSYPKLYSSAPSTCLIKSLFLFAFRNIIKSHSFISWPQQLQKSISVAKKMAHSISKFSLILRSLVNKQVIKDPSMFRLSLPFIFSHSTVPYVIPIRLFWQRLNFLPSMTITNSPCFFLLLTLI